MARGHEDKVLLLQFGYMLAALPVEVAAAYGMDVRGCVSLPCEPRAVQTLCDAVEAAKAAQGGDTSTTQENAAENAGNGVKWQAVCTWQVYYEDADDEEIAGVMAKQPCLVNIGGKIRASNPHAGRSDAAIILKDMGAYGKPYNHIAI